MAKQMKDSGVEWIGEIPEEWNIVQSRRYVSVNHGADPKTQGDIPVYGSGSISFKTCGEYKEGPTVLLGRKGTLNAPQYITGKYWNVDTAFDVAVTDDIALRFYYYLATCFDYMYYSSQTAVPSMTQSNYLSMRLPIPFINVQNCIVKLLDAKCAEIDKVVEQTRATIEEYKKLKQAIITEAVTKGVRGPRPMKLSGVEWIGDIPAEWVVLKTLWLLEMPITDGPHETPTLYDEGIPFISAEAVSCGRGRIDFSHKRGYISKEYYDECCKKYTPRLHDIYMIKSGATTGRVSMVDTEEVFTIWSPLAVLRANQEKMLPRFLFYSLQADYYQKQISLSWSFGTQQNIGMRVLEQLKIATPDADEQQEIATYLDTKCAEIDRIIEKKEQLIEEIGGYKKSLIYECVTGKREIKIHNYSKNAIC